MIPAVRVIPAVPSFTVDGGYWYALTPEQSRLVRTGTMVRVPLSGRRVRGYVVETGERDPARLKPVAAVSMVIPLFDGQLLAALEWAALRYVAPKSVMLDRASPPNLVNASEPPTTSSTVASPPTSRHPLASWAKAVAAGGRRPPVAYLGRWGDMEWLATTATPALESGRSVVVIAATGAEVGTLSEFARRLGVAPTAVMPEMSDSQVTAAWSALQSPPRLLIGTPRVAAWPAPDLAALLVVEEGRRAMKDRQTPTVAVRDLVRTRAALAGFGLAFVGPTPTLETIALGATVVRASRRAWPAVEVVDRRDEPPTPGLVGSSALAAIRAVLGRGGNVFVFAHRRGYSPASRCERCRTLRRCQRCGSRPEPGPSCPRCGAALGPCLSGGHDRFVPLGAGVGRVAEELRRFFGAEVGQAPSSTHLQVGSEADLAGLGRQDLTVAVDADGLILGSHFRSAEEALRILARVVGRVGGSSSRGLIQTYMPDHPVVLALRSGDPAVFAEAELGARRNLGFPPYSQLLVLEARGELPKGAEAALAEATKTATVLGPDFRNGRQSWLVQGLDLGPTRLSLRPLVQRWRDAGVTMRINVDPLEL
ncbi:MAG: hypothetical protein ACT4OP_01560 [Actinomycetota bacterium]